MKLYLPKSVEKILDTLHKNDYEAYIVGGCVRDSLLYISPKDYDITTDANPEQVKSLFEKSIDTGLKHGTVTIMIDGLGYEVTTYRIDGEYSDNRRPDSVKYTKSLEEDLKRRDFTINAMAYNHKKGLIDYNGGLNDINKRIIRCVGDADKRFNEDALRMMRCIRFSAQLGFDIEPDTYYAIAKNHNLLGNISNERIREELNKILLYDPQKIKLLIETKLIDIIIPEYVPCVGLSQDNPYHLYDVSDHIIYSVSTIEAVLHLRLTMLFHDIGKAKTKSVDENGVGHFYNHEKYSCEIAGIVLKRLKYDNELIEKVKLLVLLHSQSAKMSTKKVKQFLRKYGEEALRDFIKVKEADLKALNPDLYDSRHKEYIETINILDDIMLNKECFSIKDLAVNGDDIIELGYKRGKEIGILLNNMLELVIENPEINTKERLLSYIKDVTKKIKWNKYCAKSHGIKCE